MDPYVTGGMIKCLREKKKMTQWELAEKLGVSDRAVSKWETGRGYPDISLLESLAETLGVSLIELLSGTPVTNQNRSGNLKRLGFSVCPICGNVITAMGKAVVSCCGVTLPPLEPEAPEEDHAISVETVEDEYYVTMMHPMEKGHYISFFAAVTDDTAEIWKLYPEGPCEARFKIHRTDRIYAYCNRHGLFTVKI